MKINFPDHYKIGIIGSKKVGKTTLANLLVGYLKTQGADTDLVDEVAKYCPLPINKETSIEASFWILGNQIAREMVLVDRQIVVCDRTVIDVYPFAKLANINRDHDLEILKKTIVTYMEFRPYNMLFYVLPQPGFGKLYGDKFQLDLDIEFRRFLNTLSFNVVEIQGDDSSIRLKNIVKWLEDDLRI